MRTLAVVIALASSAALFAQDEKQIQDAIRGLGSESFEEREKATADLKKIGAPALQALRKAAESSDDPEVRVRAKRLVEDIDKSPSRQEESRKKRRVIGTTLHKDDHGTHYQLNPAEGDPIAFHRYADSRVKLVYPDGKGAKTEAESESLDKFLADHKELAAKYGISKEGIDYGGTKLSFSARLPAWPEMPRWDIPAVPMPEFPDWDDLFGRSEELRKAFEELRKWHRDPGLDRPAFGRFGLEVVRGAQLAPVPDVLRTQLSIPEGQGVVVESVREGSTAAAAGLKRHDVLLEIDGEKVTGPADVRARLKRDSKVRGLRSGKEQTLEPAPPRKKEF